MMEIKILCLIVVIGLSNIIKVIKVAGQESPCPNVFVYENYTRERFYGKLYLESDINIQAVKVDIFFDAKSDALSNDFGPLVSHDNKHYTINGDKNLKANEVLQITLSLKYTQTTPAISKIYLNDKQICPSSFTETCVLYKDGGIISPGRWDGSLVIYPQVSRNGIQIELVFDEKVLAVGNNLGSSTTLDSLRFKIKNERKLITKNAPLRIDFFVKFNELFIVPDLKELYINGKKSCIKKPEDVAEASSLPPNRFETSTEDFLLTDLNFNEFPAIKQIPTTFNNTNVACGEPKKVIGVRVSNGRLSYPGQFPWLAGLFIDSKFKCGSTLISSNTLITACHCITDSHNNDEAFGANRLKIMLGMQHRKKLSGNERLRKVKTVIKHPNYNTTTFIKNDIGLLILKHDVQFSYYIKPICMYSQSNGLQDFIGKKGTIGGWGRNENYLLNEELHYVQMPIVEKESCVATNPIYGFFSELTTFCAGYQKDQTVCDGDSGSSLIWPGSGNEFYLKGIVSVSISEMQGRCDPKQFVVFTEVTHYQKWIYENKK